MMTHFYTVTACNEPCINKNHMFYDTVSLNNITQGIILELTKFYNVTYHNGNRYCEIRVRARVEGRNYYRKMIEQKLK